MLQVHLFNHITASMVVIIHKQINDLKQVGEMICANASFQVWWLLFCRESLSQKPMSRQEKREQKIKQGRKNINKEKRKLIQGKMKERFIEEANRYFFYWYSKFLYDDMTIGIWWLMYFWRLRFNQAFHVILIYIFVERLSLISTRCDSAICQSIVVWMVLSLM